MFMKLTVALIWISTAFQVIDCLDNGLALTPPMGWMSWQRYRCITDCDKFPDECIGDKLIRRIADAMVSEGYLYSGYEYLIIDDCWLEKNRSRDGNLQEDSKRFPEGMKSLIDYVHSKGLKFGIYQNFGNRTCAGYPGMYGHLKQDVRLFANWEIDYIKVDGCYYYGMDYAKGYYELGQYLNRTGRPIVYSCSYPAYHQEMSIPTDFEELAENCNLWRNYNDIDDSWSSVVDILDYFALRQDHIRKFAGPGHWNDPDMLLIGNYGLSYDQSKVQMALWSVLAAPLLMSSDLTSVRPEFKAILQNPLVLKVNQDPLGIPGMRVFRVNKIEVWTRRITPVTNGYHSYAIAIYSQRVDGAPFLFQTTFKRIGLKNPSGYVIKDLFEVIDWDGEYYPNSNLTVRVNPTGVVFLKATAL